MVPVSGAQGRSDCDCEAEEMSIYPGLPFQRDTKRKRNPIRVCDDGREILDLKTSVGRKLYKARLASAWVKQKGRCALCKRPLSFEEATFDHIVPRGLGGGARNDSEDNCQAVHLLCNIGKGSRRIA